MSDVRMRRALLRCAVGATTDAAPTVADVDRWLAFARNQRAVPLLHELAAASGSTGEVGERIELVQLEVAALSVRLERALLGVADVLDDAEVPYAVLKGIATAHLDHVHPGLRQFGDVDLLVSPTDLRRARRALEPHGWAQAYPLPRHHERFTHAVAFRGVGIAEVDLHQRIGHRALGLIMPPDELLAGRVPFEIAGRGLWALGDRARLIHACIHAVASRGQYRRLSSDADVLVLSRGRAGADPRAVLSLAERWRVRPVVEAGVRGAHADAGLDLPPGWSQAMSEPMRERSRTVEWAYLGDHRRPLLEELAHLVAMDRWSDRALYLYGHLRMDEGPGAGGIGPRLRYLRSRIGDRS